MGHCLTCGSKFPGGSRYFYTCPTCETVEGIEDLREEVAESLAQLAIIQEQGFKRLSDKLSEISSVIEWGFTELSWQLQQNTDILHSIDYTLKTPNETQAKELRQMAEELRKRGVIDESEKRFLKSLELNPLDYRSYIGLALTYLHIGRFDDSKSFLEKSLPHAPKEMESGQKEKSLPQAPEEMVSTGGVLIDSEVREQLKAGNKIEAIKLLRNKTNLGLREAKDAVERFEISEISAAYDLNVKNIKIESTFKPAPAFDWKSYSYKLIGRILFCQENYIGAVEALKHSIQLSPQYADGHYDYAQYCALVGEIEDCLASLKTAIMLRPFFHNLASKEKNFDSVRDKVQELLDSLLKEALDRANVIIAKYEDELRQTEETIDEAQKQLNVGQRRSGKTNQDTSDLKLIYKNNFYEAARKSLDSAKKESEMAKELLNEMIQAVESRSYANIVTLEMGELPKLFNNSRETATKFLRLANTLLKRSSGCLLLLIVIAVNLAVVGTYLFTI